MALNDIVNAAEKLSPASPDSDSAIGLAAKKQNMDEYKAATEGGSASGAGPARTPSTSPKDKVNPKARYGSGSGEHRIDTSGMTKTLGSLAKGTPHVPTTGNYKLHEGEAVIPKDQNPLHDKMKAALSGKEESPKSALPADLAAAQATPGTSTSTGGATATRNSGAATGGAVTVTISGSSSTGTSTDTSTATTTGAGAGKGAGKGEGKGKGASAGKEPDTGDKRPHVYNISIDATGRSGDATGAEPDGDEAPSYEKGTSHVPKTGPAILHEGEAVTPKDKNMADIKDKMLASLSGDDKKPKKEIKEMHVRKTANGKHIVKHVHHHPEHHPDEEHAMDDMSALHQHMDDHAGEPNEGEAAPAGGAPTPMTAAPSPAAAPAAAPAAGPAGQ